MTSNDDSDDRSEASVRTVQDGDRLRGRFRRDPFVVLLEAAGRVPALLNAVHVRLTRLPGWIQLSTGMATSVLTIYFSRTIRTAIDGLIAVVAGAVIGRFVESSFGTQVLLALLLVVTFQVAVANSRLEGLANGAGRKFESDNGEIVDNMENEAATDGGRGHASDDADHIGICWNGVLTGIAFGIGLGSVFGVDGATGGAVFGAFVGDMVERRVIRNRRQRRRGFPEN